ncbi:MAG TPA: Holliday junction branch migration protein RuvA [Prolixibacteraceae bacterium]|jgi:Holliday junction DNA helicase RuvA|nr:Holliday junction branch migration protein RuvA [Bacteroidales bacterium]OQB81731.1 MAG: Holliday junction ATP-dependent DNA helicase RuvA [Bacteroidetes bacterium ADurb.Bin123]HNZ67739.1 Holliday junction branch migration protein RuvA [Prolixibacteraceae bacterium]HOC85437.1 Holliday junction branch migration protein RuvA [Prolixibacteraceae bacterium]HOG94715.1 Holliday junction branch migration protein RuvA [Prolixibacteraceae bacterium]
MYEFISGEIAELNPAMVVLQTGGVGYSIHISLNTFSALNGQKQVRIYTHLIVREDAHLLYGFAGKAERELFRNLLSVSGVGAATALMMLSSLSTDEIVSAINTENVTLLKSVKGIGIKTAQRIIIDLKDKVARGTPAEQILIPANNTIRNEALSALVMLGFARKNAEPALDRIIRENPAANVETVIKLTLKRL